MHDMPALVAPHKVGRSKEKLCTALASCNHVNSDIDIEVGLIAGYLGSAPPN